jgi:hypothetical protein
VENCPAPYSSWSSTCSGQCGSHGNGRCRERRWHSSWACRDVSSWWRYEGLGGFHSSTGWLPSAPRKWITARWSSVTGTPVFNRATLFPVCCRLPVLLHSLRSTTGVSCTQPRDHLRPGILATSATNGFHLNNPNIFSYVPGRYSNCIRTEMKQHFITIDLCYIVESSLLNINLVL